jgi:hypothetical protein
MKKLLIHIGWTKAASTTLQNDLAINKKNLEIIDCDFFSDKKSGNSSQYFRRQARDGNENLFDDLINYVAASSSSNVIVSAESLCKSKNLISDSNYEKLSLSVDDIKFVACLRHPYSWAVSHAQQMQKLFGRSGLEKKSFSPEYKKSIDHYTALSGNVLLINFEEIVSSQTGVTCSFLQKILGPNVNIPDNLIVSKNYNTGLCLEAIEVLNYMHEYNLINKNNYKHCLKQLRSWQGSKYVPSKELAKKIKDSVSEDCDFFHSAFPEAKNNRILLPSNTEKLPFDEYLLSKISEMLLSQ